MKPKHFPGEKMDVQRDPGEISVYGHVDKLDDVDEEALEHFIHLRRKFKFDNEKFLSFMKTTPLVFTKMLGHWVPDVNEPGFLLLSEFEWQDVSKTGRGWFKFTTIECEAEIKANIEEWDARRASGDVYPP